VESEKLNTHEVLARSDAAGHGELLPSETSGVGVLDHVVDTPDTGGSDSVTGNLEPLEASSGSGNSIVDLGKVDLGGTLVRRGNRVVRIARALRTTKTVSPSTSYGGAGGDGDELGGGSSAGTTKKVGRANVLDGVVGRRSTDTGQGALVNTIDHDTLHDGMGVDGRGGKSQSGDDGVLHFDGWKIERMIPARGLDKGQMELNESRIEKREVVEKNVESRSDAWEESKSLRSNHSLIYQRAALILLTSGLRLEVPPLNSPIPIQDRSATSD
jgi:hypothetical protein